MPLRPATPADAKDVAEILIEARRLFMPYATSPHSEAEVRDWVRSRLIAGGGVTVAHDAQGICGVLAVSVREARLWIDQLWVRPSLVCRGIGGELLGFALADGGLAARLYTFQANAGARRFYERYGFVAIEFTDGRHNEERCPDVLYERPGRRASGA